MLKWMWLHCSDSCGDTLWWSFSIAISLQMEAYNLTILQISKLACIIQRGALESQSQRKLSLNFKDSWSTKPDSDSALENNLQVLTLPKILDLATPPEHSNFILKAGCPHLLTARNPTNSGENIKKLITLCKLLFWEAAFSNWRHSCLVSLLV